MGSLKYPMTLLREEGRERDLDTERVEVSIGELSAVARVCGGSKEDSELLHRIVSRSLFYRHLPLHGTSSSRYDRRLTRNPGGER